jgi:hypothetical protein
MKIQLAVTVTVALGVMAAPADASAPAPASYRAYVNSVCRFYTPRFKLLDKQMTAAHKANDSEAVGRALGMELILQLAQDRRIEMTPIPVEIRTQIVPIVRLFKSVDRHIRLALTYAARGQYRLMLVEIRRIGQVDGGHFNKRLDRAGLRDCGSNQT